MGTLVFFAAGAPSSSETLEQSAARNKEPAVLVGRALEGETSNALPLPDEHLAYCPSVLAGVKLYCSAQMSRGASADLDLRDFYCPSGLPDPAAAAACAHIVALIRSDSDCCDPCLCLPSCPPLPPPPPPPSPCVETCDALDPVGCAVAVKRLRKFCHTAPAEVAALPLHPCAIERICQRAEPTAACGHPEVGALRRSPPPPSLAARLEQQRRSFGCLGPDCDAARASQSPDAQPADRQAEQLEYAECAKLLAGLAELHAPDAVCGAFNRSRTKAVECVTGAGCPLACVNSTRCGTPPPPPMPPAPPPCCPSPSNATNATQTPDEKPCSPSPPPPDLSSLGSAAEDFIFFAS